MKYVRNMRGKKESETESLLWFAASPVCSFFPSIVEKCFRFELILVPQLRSRMIKLYSTMQVGKITQFPLAYCQQQTAVIDLYLQKPLSHRPFVVGLLHLC